MSVISKRVYGPTGLPNSAATRYTVPANTRAIVRHIHISNTSAGPVNLTISIGADAAGTRIFDAYPVPASSVLDIWGPYTLTAAEIIQAFGSVNGQLTMTIIVDEMLEA